MNCEQIEMLMADVLGDEATPEQRATLEAHCATCAKCRLDYESALKTLQAMRSLPAPEIMLPVGQFHASQTAPLASRPRTWRVGAVLRYAAGIALAFTAGYVFHAANAARQGPTPPAITAPTPSADNLDRDDPAPRSFEAALASAHSRNPSRSDLAKALTAALGSR